MRSSCSAFSSGRDWGSPSIPEKMDLKAMVRFAPEGIRRPRWLLEFARTGRVPDLTAPNLSDGGQAPTFFGAYGEWMQTPLPTWEDIAWLREQWGGPFMLKGVMRVDDAKRAVDAGVTAVSVSNHGGNNLDGTPAPIRALPAIAEAVGPHLRVRGIVFAGLDVIGECLTEINITSPTCLREIQRETGQDIAGRAFACMSRGL